MRRVLAVALLTMLPLLMFGQRKITMTAESMRVVPLSGSLNIDLSTGLADASPDSLLAPSSSDIPGHKSAITAALYSAVIPGAGQVYAEGYWQGAAFFGAEVALWIVYSVYNKKGDDKTAFFQNFADQHWSEVRYAQWIHLTFPGVLADVNTVLLPNTAGLPPWQQINLTELNKVEDKLGQIGENGFTHEFQARPAQQHYELIGKYPQFLGGWDDAWSSPTTSLYSDLDVYNSNVTPNFHSYSLMRGDANSLYDVATYASYVLVANHVFSALEAAFAAARFNAHLRAEAHLEPRITPYGSIEFLPTARVQLEF
jgi:hypothetical protein